MKLPFTVNDFIDVFEKYNLSVWPAQPLLLFFGFIVPFCIYVNIAACRQVVFGILSILWGWMGIVYHIIYFSSINKAAYAFGAMFVVQSILFFYFGILRHKIELRIRFDVQSIVGVVFIVYALLIYPLISFAQGRIYPNSPTFGVPCPTTIFTFGVLLFTVHRIPPLILIIPMLWSLVGFSATINLNMIEDVGLLISAVLSAVILMLDRSDLNRGFHLTIF